MDLQELIYRYKDIRFFRRVTLVALIPLFYLAYTTYEELEVIAEEREQANTSENEARIEFDKAKEKKNEIPALEEKLAELETDIEEAGRDLPNEFSMNQILEMTATLARDSRCELIFFDPGKTTTSQTAYKFAQLPIQLQVSGTYNDLGIFFDKLTHLEYLISIRNLRLQPFIPKEKDTEPSASEEQDPLKKMQEQRENLRINAQVDMVLYRALTLAEQEAVDKVQDEPQNDAKEKKPL